jgi:hypothetical protein
MHALANGLAQCQAFRRDTLAWGVRGMDVEDKIASRSVDLVVQATKTTATRIGRPSKPVTA